MPGPIVNLADLEFRVWDHRGEYRGAARPSERYDARIGAISGRIGAQKLGYNLTVLPPGKAAFPRHNHRVNEEMFFILEGEGEIRIGNERHKVRAGDAIACPPGGPETAHQIANTGEAELKFLAVSTRLSPEIAEYPDSAKIGVYAEFTHNAGGATAGMRFLTRAGESVDYWEGE